jgi:penicillin-binding protein 1A
MAQIPRSAPSRVATLPRFGSGARLKLRWLRWILMVAIWGAVGLGLLFLWFSWDLPRPEAALDAVRRPGLTLEDRTGQVFATFGDVVGDSLRLPDLPPALPAAVVAVEDRRFWTHGGLDFLGLGRAALVNLRARRVVQGGSTITQQVAKNLFLTNARTFRRKVQELLLTLWLERHFSKREILEIWLNRVYLGSGAWGVDAASRMYFGVSARRLSLWQAAVIAGLPRAPSRLNPRTDPEAAAARGREVLAAMAANGVISEAETQRAVAQIAFPAPPPSAAGWYANWAAEEAQSLIPPGADAVLRTTLDPGLQKLTEAKLAALLDKPGAAAGVSEGAVVVLDGASGAVRALVGGRDYRRSSYNRAVLARRQPGSAFKPFVWLAALESGVRPDDPVLDAPVQVGNWSPANFDRRYLGEITVEEALAQSVNTTAVRLMLDAGGPRAVAGVAKRLGLADRLPDNASIALGTGEVGLLELTSAYAAFCNGGDRVTPFAVASAKVNGRANPAPHTPPEAVIDPDLAAMMAQMLQSVVKSGTGRRAAVPGRTVAGKTGTTQDYRDAWFVGCINGGSSNGLLIGIWLGNDDNRPMQGVTGSGLPAQLFRDIALGLR